MGFIDPLTDGGNPYSLVPTVLDIDLPETHIDDHSYSKSEMFIDRQGNKIICHHIKLSPGPKSGNNIDSISAVKGLGMGNVIFGFLDLYRNIIRMTQASSRLDLEAKIESALKLFSLPLGIANSIETIITFFLTLSGGLAVVSLSLSALAFGGVFLFVELALEVYRLLMINKFKNEIEADEVHDVLDNLKFSADKDQQTELERLKTYLIEKSDLLIKQFGEKRFQYLDDLLSSVTPDQMRKLPSLATKLQFARLSLTERKIDAIYTKYFELNSQDQAWISRQIQRKVKRRKSEKTTLLEETSWAHEVTKKYEKAILNGKKDRLARRIGSFGVEKISEFHRDCQYQKEAKFTSRDLMESNSLKMFNFIEQQAKKTIKVHYIGLAAIFIGVILLTLSHLAAPFVAIVAVGVVAFTLQMTRFIAPLSYLNQEGENYTLKPWKDKVCDFISPEKLHVQCIEMTTFKKSTVVENEENPAY